MNNDLSNSKWFDIFLSEGAIWQHKSNKRPHIRTSMSGNHVDAYFNSDLIVSKPKLIEEVIKDLLIPELAIINISPDWVFSFAPYGLYINYECAKQTDAYCGYTNPIAAFETEYVVEPKSKVLVVSDDIYTGSGVNKTIATLESKKAEILPIVFCLANMSHSGTLSEDRKIVAAINIHTNSYTAADCPMCKAGSQPISARANWKLLQNQ